MNAAALKFPDRLAVHIGNAAPGSALDGYAPRKERRWGVLFLVAAIPALGAVLLAVEYLRWALQ